MLGDDSGLLRALAGDFRATGMTPIIAIFGQTLVLVQFLSGLIIPVFQCHR